MSILIRGMEMPETCSNCELYQYGFCMVTRNVCDKAWTQRQDDCPLIEVSLVAQEELITPLNMIGGYLEKAEGR